MEMNNVINGDLDEAIYKGFEYKHWGNLAYIGNAAVFDLNGWSIGGGLIFVYLWRSVYFAQSVSFRTRMLLAMDWGKRALFGRGELCSDYYDERKPLTACYRLNELLINEGLTGVVKGPATLVNNM